MGLVMGFYGIIWVYMGLVMGLVMGLWRCSQMVVPCGNPKIHKALEWKILLNWMIWRCPKSRGGNPQIILVSKPMVFEDPTFWEASVYIYIYTHLMRFINQLKIAGDSSRWIKMNDNAFNSRFESVTSHHLWVSHLDIPRQEKHKNIKLVK